MLTQVCDMKVGKLLHVIADCHIYDRHIPYIKELIGNPEEKPFEKFKEICSDEELPVISRNNLENGQSANLWCEQVLPKHSVLVFAIMGEEKDDEFETFCKELNGAQVQIGANATIGYGFCKITEIC